MLEYFIGLLIGVPWYWVLVFAFLITLAENIFPPIPGDSGLLFAGTLIGLGVVGFTEMLIISTLGGILGFAIMYKLGAGIERKVIESGKIRFISNENLLTVERWFYKYGYWIIIGNRFISGIRAIVGFFAGMSKINFTTTIILATVSSLLWNTILLLLGASFGDNWKVVEKYIAIYGYILLPIVAITIAIIVWKHFKKKKNIPSVQETER
ncbi:MAG TPA: DedA family protein [Candidatus Kapabacteria bacterium]|nr:DedA family protein [Candidatus Kapabacteria bacterium]